MIELSTTNSLDFENVLQMSLKWGAQNDFLL